MLETNKSIAIIGASGLIGRRLSVYLSNKKYNITAVVRDIPNAKNIITQAIEQIPNSNKVSTTDEKGDIFNRINFVEWNGKEEGNLSNLLESHAAIIELIGENIGAKRWNYERKKELIESRTLPISHIVNAINKLVNPPRLLLSASAVGIYGSKSGTLFHESSSIGEGFLAELSAKKESLIKLNSSEIRKVFLRSGVVLDKYYGAFPKILFPYKYFVGGKIGSGNQPLSWIHIEDEISAIEFIINNASIYGPVNLVSPCSITMNKLNNEIARIYKKPNIFPVPEFFLKLVFGEMAEELLLKGQEVYPEVLLSKNFRYAYPTIDVALLSLLA